MRLSASLAIAFAVILCNADKPPPPSESVVYTLSVIEHFARDQPGRFELVILNLDTDTLTTSAYDQLLNSRSLDNVARFVINGTYQVDYRNLPHKPALIVVVYMGQKQLDADAIGRINVNFYILDSNSRVLVLLDFSKPMNWKPLFDILIGHKFNQVVLAGDRKKVKIACVDYNGRDLAVLFDYPHPKDLFKDAVRNMHGDSLIFSNAVEETLAETMWVLESALFINATVVEVVRPCSPSMGPSECRKKLDNESLIDVALDQFLFVGVSPELYRQLYNVFPEPNVMLVPRGRVLNVVELFLVPFTWQAWLMLIVILVLIEVFYVVYPQLFRNDPILQLICGFERESLHHANTRERMIFLPLILFFFLVISAYESKILSLMTQKPSLKDINTLRELSESKVGIKISKVKYHTLEFYAELGIELINSSDSAAEMDGVSAYQASLYDAYEVVRYASNYDVALNRPKYKILNEQLRMQVYSFYVQLKSPLREVLYYTQRTFFESGILLKWKLDEYELYTSKNHSIFAEYMAGKEWLAFDDLLPAWIAFSVGVVLSGIAFAGELMTRVFCGRNICNNQLQ